MVGERGRPLTRRPTKSAEPDRRAQLECAEPGLGAPRRGRGGAQQLARRRQYRCRLHFSSRSGDGDRSTGPRATGVGGIPATTFREWDTAIVLRNQFETGIIEKRGALLALRHGQILGRDHHAAAHLPAAWHDEENRWQNEVDAMQSVVQELRHRHGAHTIIAGGDWNTDLDNVQNPRTEFLAEWSHATQLRERSVEVHTHSWRHPASGDMVDRRIDTFFTSEGQWQAKVLDKITRSDHQPLLLLRRGRVGHAVRRRRDAQPRIARQRAWQPRTWREQQAPKTALTRAMVGVDTMQGLQSALRTVVETVSSYTEGEGYKGCDGDEQLDCLRERIERLEARRTRLLAAARRASEPEVRAKCARGAWRTRLLLAKSRVRLRAREAAEGGVTSGSERESGRRCGGMSGLPPVRGPTQLAPCIVNLVPSQMGESRSHIRRPGLATRPLGK